MFRDDPGSRTRAYVMTAPEAIADTPELARGLDSWKAWARRGLYAYDWADVHRPSRHHSHCYELIAAPIVEARVEQLPPPFRLLAGRRGVTFSLAPTLDVSPWLSSSG
jgi:hypothetical protein